MMIDTIKVKHGGIESIQRDLLDEIKKGLAAIEALNDITYRRRSIHSASVGAQFRHNLDFLNTFLRGIAVGRIDYTDRERDPRVERSRKYAVTRFEEAARRISLLSRSKIGSIISVRSEIDQTSWLVSTVAREIEFVRSHMTHHHALIAEKLINMGVLVDASLGFAPSTTEYRRRMAA